MALQVNLKKGLIVIKILGATVVFRNLFSTQNDPDSTTIVCIEKRAIVSVSFASALLTKTFTCCLSLLKQYEP